MLYTLGLYAVNVHCYIASKVFFNYLYFTKRQLFRRFVNIIFREGSRIFQMGQNCQIQRWKYHPIICQMFCWKLHWNEINRTERKMYPWSPSLDPSMIKSHVNIMLTFTQKIDSLLPLFRSIFKISDADEDRLEAVFNLSLYIFT